jgi:hypothetical protein
VTYNTATTFLTFFFFSSLFTLSLSLLLTEFFSVRQEKNELPRRQSAVVLYSLPSAITSLQLECVVREKRQDVEQLLLAVDAVVFFPLFFSSVR